MSSIGLSRADSEGSPRKLGVSRIAAFTVAMLALTVTLLLYWDVFRWLWQTWLRNRDYSHGFLVVPFAAFLAKTSMNHVQKESLGRTGIVLGLGCILGALILRSGGIYTGILTLEALSLLPFLIGIAALISGTVTVRALLPAILFLVFMIPLPGFLSGSLSGVLQSIATMVSTFCLQTLGVPAVSTGNIITLSNGTIGVAEACSGIRMLYSFFALTVGTCLLIDRTWIEKLLIALSAVPIAILVNCARIVATGLAYEYLNPQIAGHIFHDLAGWLMMPLGFFLLLLFLGFLDRAVETEATLDTLVTR